MNGNQNQHQSPIFSMQQQDGPSSHCLADQTDEYDSVKWTTSKMNLMKKMLGSDKITVKNQRKNQYMEDQDLQNQASSNNSPNEIIRVCTNCNTTKTPLWRGGPLGPKSLCNACGIRQMKARRAMRLAADVDRTVPFKKRFKIFSASLPSPFQF